MWLAAATLVYHGPLQAKTDVEVQSFDDLSKDQRRVLAPLAETWDQLSPEARDRLLKGAERWLSMTETERLEAAERLARWQQLDAQRRAEIRRRYEAFMALPPEQRKALSRTFNRFRGMSEEQRSRLMERWAQTPPEQRRAFLEGARVGRERAQGQMIYGLWREAFPQVTAEERDALRQMVQSLGPVRQRQLLRIMLNMSGDERLATRPELLSLSPAELDAWIETRAQELPPPVPGPEQRR